MNMPLLVVKAMMFAAEAHTGQMRDDGKLPYIVHPAQTAALISVLTDDADVIAAAWLHDVLEDTPTSYQVLEARFGKRVADLVNEVTHEKNKDGSAYFPRLKSREAVLIKFCDRASNLSDMSAWSEKRIASYIHKSSFWNNEAKSDLSPAMQLVQQVFYFLRSNNIKVPASALEMYQLESGGTRVSYEPNHPGGKESLRVEIGLEPKGL